LVGAGMFFPLRVAAGLVASGLLFYLVLRSPMAYWKRVTAVIAIFAAGMLLLANAVAVNRILGSYYIPMAFLALFGSVFMFRMMIYAHDIRYAKTPPRLQEFLAYFFILPNYVFLLFPVIDFKTMRLGYFRRDIHEVAQQGVWWICRGTVQLLLYN